MVLPEVAGGPGAGGTALPSRRRTEMKKWLSFLFPLPGTKENAMIRQTDYPELAGLLQATPLTRRTVLVTALSAGFAAGCAAGHRADADHQRRGPTAGEAKIPTADGESPPRAMPASAGRIPSCWSCRSSFGAHRHQGRLPALREAGVSGESRRSCTAPGDVSKLTDFRESSRGRLNGRPERQLKGRKPEYRVRRILRWPIGRRQHVVLDRSSAGRSCRTPAASPPESQGHVGFLDCSPANAPQGTAGVRVDRAKRGRPCGPL